MKQFLLACILFPLALTAQTSKPNIIYIMADDLGYGELGCYGQQKIKTPNIDRLSAEGMRFTQYYATTLCASTRCSFVTGMDGGHAQVRDNLEFGGFRDEEEFGQMPLAPNTMTIATELRKAGYATALIGKWGLGGPGTEGVPNKQGFDLFYGYLDQKQAHNYYPTHLWRNETREDLGQSWFSAHQLLKADSTNPVNYAGYSGKIYSPDTMTGEAVKYIRSHTRKPFFLYLAYTLPHLSLQVPDESLRQYQNVFEETPYTGRKGYLPHIRPRSAYAAMISRLDLYVGMIMKTLQEAGLDKNTLVIFTSDNGATVPGTGGADTKFFESNGKLRGYKGSLYEGGIREPFIARWPGKIRAGRTNDKVCAVWDLFATFNAVAGNKTTAVTNGVSLFPEFYGLPTPQHEYLYWEVHDYENGIQAVRWNNWKAVRSQVHKNPDAPVELYDLGKDPGEKDNVAGAHPDIIEKMKAFFSRRSRAVVKEWNF